RGLGPLGCLDEGPELAGVLAARGRLDAGGDVDAPRAHPAHGVGHVLGGEAPGPDHAPGGPPPRAAPPSPRAQPNPPPDPGAAESMRMASAPYSSASSSRGSPAANALITSDTRWWIQWLSAVDSCPWSCTARSRAEWAMAATRWGGWA